MSTLRVLIADDHAVVRDGLRLVIDHEPDLRVVAVACDGEEALAAAREHAPHVVVLDLRMPKLGGVAAIRALREHCPEAKLLVLSMYDDERFASAARAAGAHGYLGKHVDAPTLLRAIRELHRSGTLDRDSARASQPELGSAGEAREALSVREREVLRLLLDGHTGSAIAAALGITKSSVDTYRARIFHKLGVRDRVELIAQHGATQRGPRDDL